MELRNRLRAIANEKMRGAKRDARLRVIGLLLNAREPDGEHLVVALDVKIRLHDPLVKNRLLFNGGQKLACQRKLLCIDGADRVGNARVLKLRRAFVRFLKERERLLAPPEVQVG